MLSTPCAKLGIPSVTYAEGSEVDKTDNEADDSGWIFLGKTFVHRNANKVFRGFVLYTSDLLDLAKGNDTDNNTLIRYMNDLRWISHLQHNKLCQLNWVHQNGYRLNSLDVNTIDNGFKAAKAKGANFIVLILPKRNIPAHSTFKDLADRKYGLRSLCLTEAPN